MPTKPLTQPEYWATDLVYTTGPFIGQPQKVVPPAAFAAEGHRPGANFPTPAEYENSQQNRITALCQWVFSGSFAGAADAHICEVDSNGEGQVERWRVVPANANSYALYVQAPPGAGFAIQATGASALSDPTIYTETTGPGAALEAFSAGAGSAIIVNHSGTSDGVVVNQPGGAGDCVVINCAGTGTALLVYGGPDMPAATITGGGDQVAVSAISGTDAGAAVGALGVGTALGVDAQGGATSAAAYGVRGSAVNANSQGVYGRSAAAASNSGSGVYAEGRGSGAGLRAVAAAFHAAIFQGDTTSPAFAAVRLLGANARPSTATGGSLEYVTTEEQLVVGNALDNAFRAVWTTGPGKVTGVDANNIITVNNAADWTLVASIVATDGDAPRTAGGTVVLRFRCEAKTSTGIVNGLDVQFRDLTAGATLITRSGLGGGDTAGFALPVATVDWQRSILLDFATTIPAAGDRTWQVWAKPSSGVNNIRLRDAVFTADGLY